MVTVNLDEQKIPPDKPSYATQNMAENIDPKYIIKIKDNNFIRFEGLLVLGHNEGLKRINTQVIQFPCKENYDCCVVSAEIETKYGVFSAIGDSTPRNVNPSVKGHMIRIAETRAIARALRFALRIGMVCTDEIEDI